MRAFCQRDLCIATAVFVVLTVYYFTILPRYGMTWDESENFQIGERNIYFWSTLNSDYLDEHIHRPPGFESIFWNDLRPWRYPPVANLMSAVTAKLLHHWTGLLRLVAAHHAANYLFLVPLCVLLYIEGNRFFGFPAGLATVLFTLLHPRFWHHAHSNIKDVPVACLVGIAALAALRGLSLESGKWIVLSGVAFGLALATKANAFFLPFVVVPGFVVYGASKIRREEPVPSRLAMSMTLWLFIGLAVFILLWPYLWENPAIRFGKYLEYCGSYGYENMGSVPWKLDPFFWFLTTTPLPVLALGFGGTVFVCARFCRRTRAVLAVLLLWLLVPLLRGCLPGVPQVDGIRRYLEYVPSLGMLAGAGVAGFFRWGESAFAPSRWSRHKWATLGFLLGLPLLLLLWIHVRMVPHSIAYFNATVGGPKGAWDRGIPQSGDYYGSSCYQAAGWLNENVEPNARISILLCEHLFRVDHRLRSDIWHTYEFPAEGNIDYVVFLVRPELLPESARFFEKKVEPLKTIEVEGVPLVQIFRVTPEVMQEFEQWRSHLE